MITELFSLYDAKAKFYGSVFSQANIQTGIRQFKDAVNSDTAVGKNPSDFTLFHVGTFDCETGVITPVNESVCNGAELVDANFTQSR